MADSQQPRIQKLRKTVEFDADVLEFFDKHYPPGTLWWFTNRVLRKLMELHEEEEVTPLQDTIDKLAASLKDDLQT